MRRSIAILVLLVVCAFCLSLSLGQSLDTWTQGKARKGDLMELLLGDSRKLIGQYLFTKADVYFHSGFYISQFEHPKTEGHGEENHMAGESAEEHEEHMREAAKYQPRDWIEAFGRKFYPTTHTHLDQGGSDNGKEGVAEIMPWLKMSAELDPNRIETYTVAAYWLTQRMKKPKEAEQFLREGLRANPGNPALLYELSRLAEINDHDHEKERNLLELALKKWQEQEGGKKEPNEFLLEEIYAHLAQVEVALGNYESAIRYFGLLKKLSPHPEMVEKRIDELKEKMASNSAGK
jgi:tetratricopeptide (TPR) repeat protein